MRRERRETGASRVSKRAEKDNFPSSHLALSLLPSLS
jgi:outer membrane murein-binding lipoprotein Lpp